MNIKFTCPQCGKHLVATPEMIGQHRSCPKCKASITVPATSSVDASQSKKEKESPTRHALMLGTGHREQENLIDMTAMVDIVFFILIFFMVTSIQALQSVIELPQPQTSEPSASNEVAPDYTNDPSFITLTIDADDTIWVDDEHIFGGQELRVKLREIRRGNAHITGMMVLGDPEASHGTLVMVLDAGADAGITDLRFSVATDLDLTAG